MRTAISILLLLIGIPQAVGLAFALVPGAIITAARLPLSIETLVWPKFFVIGLFGGIGGALCSWRMFGFIGAHRTYFVPVLAAGLYLYYAWSKEKLPSREWLGQIIGFCAAWAASFTW